MKKFALIISTLLLLTSCAKSESPIAADQPASIEQIIPTDCNQQGVIDSFIANVPGSKYVPTDWQPSPGTDLAAVFENGGIACSYGIQTAEVGGTVMWASNSNDVWNERSAQWKKDGQIKFDIPQINETDAYVLKEGTTSADEMHVWAVNLLIGGVWIQVGATFLQNIDEALPIIQAAVDAAIQK